MGLKKITTVMLLLVTMGQNSQADQVLQVAVASNFLRTAKRLSDDFTATRPDIVVRLVSGSTGKLYAQIVHGAPYHIFLSADAATPQKLCASGLALAESQFTYAEGVLVLAAKSHEASPTQQALVNFPNDKKIALAQPALAPYGRAAEEVLRGLHVFTSVSPQLVFGENVLQAQHFLESGLVDLAFIARPSAGEFSYWEIPRKLYAPIAQNGVTLSRGGALTSSEKFMAYMRSPRAQKIITQAGYRVPREPDAHVLGVHP